MKEQDPQTPKASRSTEGAEGPIELPSFGNLPTETITPAGSEGRQSPGLEDAPADGLRMICRSYMYVQAGPLRDAVNWIARVLAAKDFPQETEAWKRRAALASPGAPQGGGALEPVKQGEKAVKVPDDIFEKLDDLVDLFDAARDTESGNTDFYYCRDPQAAALLLGEIAKAFGATPSQEGHSVSFSSAKKPEIIQPQEEGPAGVDLEAAAIALREAARRNTVYNDAWYDLAPSVKADWMAEAEKVLLAAGCLRAQAPASSPRDPVPRAAVVAAIEREISYWTVESALLKGDEKIHAIGRLVGLGHARDIATRPPGKWSAARPPEDTPIEAALDPRRLRNFLRGLLTAARHGEKSFDLEKAVENAAREIPGLQGTRYIPGTALRALPPEVPAPGTPIEKAAREPARIDQTVTGAKGNCYSACLAMLLGVPISEVPNFCEAPGFDEDPGPAFNKASKAWLAARGWGHVTIDCPGAWVARRFPKGYVIVSGMSPRGMMHAVVYKDGALWHDPYPDHVGIVEPLEVDLIFPLNPMSLSGLPQEPAGESWDLREARKTVRSQGAELKAWHEAYGPIPPKPKEYLCLKHGAFRGNGYCPLCSPRLAAQEGAAGEGAADILRDLLAWMRGRPDGKRDGHAISKVQCILDKLEGAQEPKEGGGRG